VLLVEERAVEPLAVGSATVKSPARAVEPLAVGSATVQSPARKRSVPVVDAPSSPVLRKKSKKARKNGNYMYIKIYVCVLNNVLAG